MIDLIDEKEVKISGRKGTTGGDEKKAESKKNDETYPRSETYSVECPMCKWLERTVILKNEDETGQFIGIIDSLRPIIKNGLTHQQLTILQQSWSFDGSNVKISDCTFPLNDRILTTVKKKKDNKEEKKEHKNDIDKREIYNKKFFGNVKYQNIKGLDVEIKEIKTFIKHQKIFIKKRYVERGYTIGKGILLEGPPGVSKTDLIKATYNEILANDSSAKAVVIKLRELIKSNDVGENLQNIHDIFVYANSFEEDQGVSTIFVVLDEFEAISQDRGNTKGVNERNITLGIMDEIDNLGEKCIIMAASNYAIQTDSALLRGARIDKVISIPLPNKEARKEIFEYYYNNIHVPKDNNIDMEKIAELLEGYTGADIMSMCRDLSAEIDYRIENGDNTAILTMEMLEQDIKTGTHKTEDRLLSIRKSRKVDKRRIDDEKDEKAVLTVPHIKDIPVQEILKICIEKGNKDQIELANSFKRQYTLYRDLTPKQYKSIYKMYRSITEYDAKAEQKVEKNKLKENIISKLTLDEMKRTTEKQHQTGFKGDGTKVEPKIEKKEEPKVEKKEEPKVKENTDKMYDLICDKCDYRCSASIVDLMHGDLVESTHCLGYMIEDDSKCSICKQLRNGKNIEDLGEGGFVHTDCINKQMKEQQNVDQFEEPPQEFYPNDEEANEIFKKKDEEREKQQNKEEVKTVVEPSIEKYCIICGDAFVTIDKEIEICNDCAIMMSEKKS